MGVYCEEVRTPNNNTRATLKLGVRGWGLAFVFLAWAFFMKTPVAQASVFASTQTRIPSSVCVCVYVRQANSDGVCVCVCVCVCVRSVYLCLRLCASVPGCQHLANRTFHRCVRPLRT